MNIGNNIKNKRLELGMTLEDLAQKLGTSRQTLSRYETGIISNIPSDKIEKIAEALQTTPAYIMGWNVEEIKRSSLLKELLKKASEDEKMMVACELLTQLPPEGIQKAGEYLEFLLQKQKEAQEAEKDKK